MNRNLSRIFALTLLASLTLASSQVLADDNGSGSQVYVKETATVSGKTLNLVLPIQSGAHDYFSGSANISVGTTSSNGTSFLAYCIDPFQWSSSSSLSYNVSSLSSLGSTQAADVSKLYSQSYASTSGNSVNSAAFQLALWELAKDDGVLTSGAVRTTDSTNSTVEAAASSMINNAKNGVAGSTQYAFNLYSNGYKQDYLVASIAAVTPVPEPETYAMLLAGLGLIGFTARRRLPSR